MQIPLNRIDQYIDKTILKRGLTYFNNGHVHQPKEIQPSEYEAIVEGTEDYTVRLTLKDDIITEFVCNCPYDLGPVCKHVAAVIFYFQHDKLGLDRKTKKTIKEQSPKPSKRKTIAERINEMLEKAPHEELKQFIRNNADNDPSFRNIFLSSFARYNTDESKEIYIKQVKSILRSATDRHGSIDWSAAGLVRKAVIVLLNSALEQVEKGNYKSAFFICTAVMEQMTDAMQYADDSNGDIGGSIDDAFELLNSIAQKQPSEEIRRLILEYCFTVFDKEIYSGWDWHIDILRLASHLIKTDEETERIIFQIEKAQTSDYERERAGSIKYSVLLKTKGEDSADRFLEQNITNSDLRRIAIQKSIDRKKFDEAISLAKNGYEYDLKLKPGLAEEWCEWLLKIAQVQNDTERIVQYARQLFLHNFRNEQDYYHILKQNIESENWNVFIESIIQEITENKKWINTWLLASIYINEQMWDRLLELVKNAPDLRIIEQYEKYLSKNYSCELVQLYADAIVQYMKDNVSRVHYQNACRYLRKIIKLGKREKANEIISYLKNEYPQRKALLEELNNV